MTDKNQSPSTTDLAARCQAEENNWRNRSSPATLSDCWELFRRAIMDNDQEAWSALYRQYRSLIANWGRGAELKSDDLINETFMRFWQAVQDQDFPAHFSTIQQVKGFLKRCARNLAIDAYRRRQRQEVVESARHDLDLPGQSHFEQTVVDRLFSQEQQTYLRSRLRDEEEQLVFRLIYEFGMKPREIMADHPDRFADTRAISRIRERIIRRLAADPRLENWKDDTT